MAIDDLADRPHDCDLLLDQNLYDEPGRRYAGLVPERCTPLVGPAYALLRDEFGAARAKRKHRDGSVRRLVVFFGGSDPGDETSKALAAVRILRASRPELEADVVVGTSNPHRAKVEAICREIPGTRFHCQIANMAELMAGADLAFGAGGTASWERCCVGLPALAAILAENQRELLENAHRRGVAVSLGWADRITAEDYARAADTLSPARLKEMEARCLELVDGRGRDRVTEALLHRKGV
jgi:UDP-2,4-diacetamido-2,4,6-trideoxy-beta-L-altropyranose hydrolase